MGLLPIFQSAIDAILQGLQGVIAYLDDILITGSNEQEHFDRLRALFTRLKEAGIKLKREKCEFCLPSLSYLGHIIDAFGTKPDPEKVRAVVDCAVPENAEKLRSFLGMANYYGKFISNLSGIAAPLYALTRTDADYNWSEKEQQAFDHIKRALTSNTILAHYDPNRNRCRSGCVCIRDRGRAFSQRQCIERPIMLHIQSSFGR